MIYQGQELGEPAIESEGYSGKDGRTTIFDYWSVDTLRRWYNNGKCDTSRLTKQEKTLRGYYKKVLRLCNKEQAISQGGFFDLMYVNHESMNSNKVYAYYRYHGEDRLLIIANFNNRDEHIALHTPQHALDVMKMQAGNYIATHLLTGQEHDCLISADIPLELTISSHNAMIIKLVKRK